MAFRDSAEHNTIGRRLVVGGIDYSKLGLMHRAMMAIMKRVIACKGKREALSEVDRLLLETYAGKADFSDRATIAPLVEHVRGLERQMGPLST